MPSLKIYPLRPASYTMHPGGNCITLFGKGFAPAPSVMYVHVGENDFHCSCDLCRTLTLLGLFSVFHLVCLLSIYASSFPAALEQKDAMSTSLWKQHIGTLIL